MTTREEVEDSLWWYFIEWLRDASFDPRNGEHIDTLFWWWFINIQQREPTPVNSEANKEA